jgi:hypothetical protein
MAKKKRLKFSRKQRKQIVRVGLPVLAAALGLFIGVGATNLYKGRRAPQNLVWAADKGVKVPNNLRKFLETKNDCKAYRGTNTPTGVGLWGVYQVADGRYAKIAYGCSWSLNTYVMAVKQKGAWQLLKPTEYFAPFKDGLDPTKGALPFCTMVEKYKIPHDIEPFCIQPDGSAKSNEL